VVPNWSPTPQLCPGALRRDHHAQSGRHPRHRDPGRRRNSGKIGDDLLRP